MEGHYIRGYGDRSSVPRLNVLEGAYESAAHYLGDDSPVSNRLKLVAELLDGWETPYGLELLATVHWALTKVDPKLSTHTAVYSYVAQWTPRKAQLFKPTHVSRAIDHLVFVPETGEDPNPGTFSLCSSAPLGCTCLPAAGAPQSGRGSGGH